MYREQTRYGKNPDKVIRAADATFYAPARWDIPAKVFTCSWSDFFIEQADEWRDEAWHIIYSTPHLTYQILTKRPGNIAARLPSNWGGGWLNVWLGVSVESEEQSWRAEKLIEIPSATRFISYEPALGPVDFSPVLDDYNWLISGGESGPNARPVKMEWFDDVRDQCARYGVAYFHKQNGGATKINGHYGGNTLMGEVYRQFPHAPNTAMQPNLLRSASQIG